MQDSPHAAPAPGPSGSSDALLRLIADSVPALMAYYDLPGEHRGTFVQQLLKALFDRPDGEAIRTQLEARLQPIGWTVTSDGLLVPRMPWSPRPTSPQLHL